MTPSIYSDSILYRKSRCIQTWIQKRNWHWLCRWLGIRRIQTYISVNSARMFGDYSLKVDIYVWALISSFFVHRVFPRIVSAETILFLDLALFTVTKSHCDQKSQHIKVRKLFAEIRYIHNDFSYSLKHMCNKLNCFICDQLNLRENLRLTRREFLSILSKIICKKEYILVEEVSHSNKDSWSKNPYRWKLLSKYLLTWDGVIHSAVYYSGNMQVLQ